jgi:hypothetical protein
MKLLALFFVLNGPDYAPPKAPRFPPVSAPACSNPVKAARCGRVVMPRRWKR